MPPISLGSVNMFLNFTAVDDNDDMFKPPNLDNDDFSPFEGKSGLFSGGRGLFDDDDEVGRLPLALFASIFPNPLQTLSHVYSDLLSRVISSPRSQNHMWLRREKSAMRA